MKKIVVYQNSDGFLTLIHPDLSSISAYECGRKCTPSGVPFKIFTGEQIPNDTTFIDAWEADFSSPDGLGIGVDAWHQERDANANLGDPDKDYIELTLTEAPSDIDQP